MADSDALVKRRYRHHKAGDHGLCVPGRCKALDTQVMDIQPATGSGARLWAALTAEGDLPPLMHGLAVEACRILDRLDTLDRQLAGHDWLRFRHDETGTEVTVYVDRVLAEAREQATALKGIVAELDKGLPKAEPAKKGGGVLADLAARRAARSGAATH
ncbi:hypothetical protein [Sinomonas sp.]|jgi:hypothetical protein|uniref:hypothetical protein n=1 Tax=Sinomonas sp. TaxID=1914986 RepID=UPI003F7F20F7